jgi:hypothetical protein
MTIPVNEIKKVINIIMSTCNLAEKSKFSFFAQNRERILGRKTRECN